MHHLPASDHEAVVVAFLLESNAVPEVFPSFISSHHHRRETGIQINVGAISCFYKSPRSALNHSICVNKPRREKEYLHHQHQIAQNSSRTSIRCRIKGEQKSNNKGLKQPLDLPDVLLRKHSMLCCCCGSSSH